MIVEALFNANFVMCSDGALPSASEQFEAPGQHNPQGADPAQVDVALPATKAIPAAADGPFIQSCTAIRDALRPGKHKF